VVAVAEGGPGSLITEGVTGRLCPSEAGALGQAVAELVGDPRARRRLARAALEAVKRWDWDRSLGQLATGYRRAVSRRGALDQLREAV
jgi:glycosyltransferase involved in cell wall biosynthesis